MWRVMKSLQMMPHDADFTWLYFVGIRLLKINDYSNSCPSTNYLGEVVSA